MASRLRAALPTQTVIELGRSILEPGGDLSSLLVSRGKGPTILLGDTDAWLARWGALGSLRETTEVLFDGCSTGEFRTLTGSRDIPPPMNRGERALWLLRPDGSVHRARLDP